MNKVVDREYSGFTFADNVSDYKIYAFKGISNIYKLHRINERGIDRYAFISLENSLTYANGTFDSLRRAIETTIVNDTVFEFDNVREFLEWATEQYEDSLDD